MYTEVRMSFPICAPRRVSAYNAQTSQLCYWIRTSSHRPSRNSPGLSAPKYLSGAALDENPKKYVDRNWYSGRFGYG